MKQQNIFFIELSFHELHQVTNSKYFYAVSKIILMWFRLILSIAPSSLPNVTHCPHVQLGRGWIIIILVIIFIRTKVISIKSSNIIV